MTVSLPRYLRDGRVLELDDLDPALEAALRDVAPTPPPRRLWVFEEIGAQERRYSLLGFSREVIAQDEGLEGLYVSAPSPGGYGNHHTLHASSVKTALHGAIASLLHSGATCISHGDCLDAAARGDEEVALRCARGQLRALFESNSRALRLTTTRSKKQIFLDKAIRRTLRPCKDEDPFFRLPKMEVVRGPSCEKSSLYCRRTYAHAILLLRRGGSSNLCAYEGSGDALRAFKEYGKGNEPLETALKKSRRRQCGAMLEEMPMTKRCWYRSLREARKGNGWREPAAPWHPGVTAGG